MNHLLAEQPQLTGVFIGLEDRLLGLPRPTLPEQRRDAADAEILAGLDFLPEVLCERL